MASTKIIRKNKSYILYDACIISKPGENLFDPVWLQNNAEIKQIGVAGEGDQENMIMGRGAAWFVDYENQKWVLRHYKRGGLTAHWNKELYLGLFPGASRSMKEWYFLNSLFSSGLPVPQPIAACVSWPYGRILGLYKAAIIVQTIPQAMTLAEKCQLKSPDMETWQDVGRCIQKFHRHGVCHADLNANNILFDVHNKVFLIDFDKSSIRPAGAWMAENLSRLSRSLKKLQGLYDGFNFSEQSWDALMEGYNKQV